MTSLQLRSVLIDAKKQYGRGEITIEQLYTHANAYITSIKAYAKASGKKVPNPSPSYIIRAIG